MKFAKMLLTACFLVYFLLVPVSRVASHVYGTGEPANTRVPPPPTFRPPPTLKLSPDQAEQGRAVTNYGQFSVTYTDVPSGARIAFGYAVRIWASIIKSPVPIRIDVRFMAEDPPVARARVFSWGPFRGDRLYTYSLYDALTGTDNHPNEPDVIIMFNKDEDWYFGTDGNPSSDQLDFVTVALHEIGHGLGFSSPGTKVNKVNGVLTGHLRNPDDGFIKNYDRFIVGSPNKGIIEFLDPSIALGQQLTGNNLRWIGVYGVVAAGRRSVPKLYAPSEWDGGSSYSHLDEETYPKGNPNSIMTPKIETKEANHNPGPIAIGMLKDMGWTLNAAPVFSEGYHAVRFIAENALPYKKLGVVLHATDSDGDGLTYRISERDGAPFRIVETSGQLILTNLLDYETKPSYLIKVSVSDERHATTEIPVKIVVTDIPLDERTPRVRDAIVDAIPGVNSATQVTAAHLAAITELDLRNKAPSVDAGDFNGLSSLRILRLDGNHLSNLPVGVFNGLSSLEYLSLHDSEL